jgi:hypothetical protein
VDRLIIAASWSTYGLLKRASTSAGREPGRRDVPLVDPGARAGARDGRRHRGSIPRRRPDPSGCSSPSRASSPPPRCCSSPTRPSASRSPCSGPAVPRPDDQPRPRLGRLRRGHDRRAAVGFALVWVGLVLITIDHVGQPARDGARRRPSARLTPTAGN